MSIIRIRWHMQRPILQPIWPCRWQAAEHLLEVVYVQLPSKLPQSLANANMVWSALTVWKQTMQTEMKSLCSQAACKVTQFCCTSVILGAAMAHNNKEEKPYASLCTQLASNSPHSHPETSDQSFINCHLPPTVTKDKSLHKDHQTENMLPAHRCRTWMHSSSTFPI